MKGTTDQPHVLSVDGGCIVTNIYLDNSDLGLVLRCLRAERSRIAFSDSSSWGHQQDLQEQCDHLINRVARAFSPVEPEGVKG